MLMVGLPESLTPVHIDREQELIYYLADNAATFMATVAGRPYGSGPRFW